MKEARAAKDPIRIAGPARLDRPGDRRPLAGNSGYALTHNVDADIFEQWMKDNATSSMVVNKQIFANAKTNEVVAVARENEMRKSGLEPINPDGDSRISKKRIAMGGGAVSAVGVADKAA